MITTPVLPAVSGLIMVVLSVYICVNVGDLTGTAGGGLRWILPALIPVAAVIGRLAAIRLERAKTGSDGMAGRVWRHPP